jgi:CHAT domain-containing protein
VRTLHGFVQKGHRNAYGIDAVAQMLRVTAFSRDAKVGRALSAGSLRASVGDPDLAALIRQEQDVTEEQRVAGELLAYLSSGQGQGREYGSATALRQRLNTLGLARSTLRAEILERFPEFAELTSPSPMTLAEIRSSLAAHQSLVVFHVADEVTYAWAVPAAGRGEVMFASLPLGRLELAGRVAALREAVDPGALETVGDIPPFDVAGAHALYQSLLSPLRDGWKNATELVVVANGALGALPLPLLVTEPPDAADDGDLLFSGYRQVAWLGRDVAVTYLPSVSSLVSLSTGGSPAAAGRRPFVGFGDPFFSAAQAEGASGGNATRVASRGFSLRSAPSTRAVDSADLAMLPRLPDTRNEILAVGSSLGADPAQDIYLGKRASETVVRSADLSRYKVLSFATHGLVPGDLDGLRQPALALSSPAVTGEADADGLLTMSEILGLELNADVAILSACNTASADGQGAEAVSGLGRAFFYAGSRALLVSNWSVHSGATTELMSEMFDALSAERTLTRTEALRRTQLGQIESGSFEADGKVAFSYAHPIFWAAFTVVGDGGR